MMRKVSCCGIHEGENMSPAETRISELRESFLNQPSAKAIGASLAALSKGYAEIEVTISEDMLVNGDLPSKRFAQGGFLMGVLPNFAGVYAAMTLSRGHALLVGASDVKIERPAISGERLRASAVAERNGLVIAVSWQVESAETEEVKSAGCFRYRLKSSESVPEVDREMCEAR